MSESSIEQPLDSVTDPIDRIRERLESSEIIQADPESESQEQTLDNVNEEVIEESLEDQASDAQELEDEPAEADDDDLSGEQEEEMLFEVGGEQLTAEELKLGYLRQSDYTKKTQQVAEQRKAFEAQSNELQATMSALMAGAGANIAHYDGVNWEQLAIQDPERYTQAKAAYEQTRQTYEFFKSQSEHVQAQNAAREEAENAERAKESIAVLKSTIPDWNNDLYYKIGAYAQEDLGVTAEEFNKVADHRLITALYKAMQFDKASETAAAKRKAAKSKNLSGSRANTSPGAQESEAKLFERLRSSRNTEDAAALIARRMK